MWNPTARLFKFVHLLLPPIDSNRRRGWQTLSYLDGFIGRLWSNTGRMRPNSARSSRCSASLSSCSPSCATWACWRGSLSPPTSPLYSPFSSYFGSSPRYAKSFGISRPCSVDVAWEQVPPQNPSDALENPGKVVDHTTQLAAPYHLPSGRLLLSSAENYEARPSRATHSEFRWIYSVTHASPAIMFGECESRGFFSPLRTCCLRHFRMTSTVIAWLDPAVPPQLPCRCNPRLIYDIVDWHG